ncbi:carbonic anhydrase [Glacieibacterium sp.]|uniref:carbonic anhydrase n=1 Tax=Glacieibacterium sp. TaxID=2860237 RepID=UPI003AFFF35B
MNDILSRVFSFEQHVFPNQAELYSRLAHDGQSPKALMISCADSRVVPEHIMQAEPGDLFVCRNAGNIVPPYAQANGGVSSTVEYAVMGLGVRDIIVCGHSDCGAMKALDMDDQLARMPNVAAWLRHSNAARQVVDENYPHQCGGERVRSLAMENITAQIDHLRTHPSVASALARGELTLHGWFVDIHAGVVLGLDGASGLYKTLRADRPLPVAVARPARENSEAAWLEAAE